MSCKKCGSRYIMEDGICGKCGTWQMPVNYVPYTKVTDYSKLEEGIKQAKQYNHNHRGTCRCCTRPDMSIHSDNLCGSCYHVIRGIKQGPEREEKLYAYKMKKWAHKFKKGLVVETPGMRLVATVYEPECSQSV